MENIFKGFNLMKKLLLFVLLFLAPFPLIALQQNNVTIPEYINIYNSSEASVEIDGTTVQSKQTITLESNGKGSFAIKSNKRRYLVSYPTLNARNAAMFSRSNTTAYLDFTTIQWIAGDAFKLFPQGLDSVLINNDTYYPIAALFVLNAQRSSSRTIDSQETLSKIVSTQDNQKTGFLELIDNNRKKHTFSFPRRIYLSNNTHTTDWHEITLRAQTISWFDNGFKVTVR